MNTSNKSKVFPLQFETIDLEFEIFKRLSNFKYDYKFNNISRDEFYSIKKFIQNKPFKIADCDKNLGISFLDHKIYNEPCLEYLNDNEYFQELESNPLDDTVSFIKSDLIDLKNNKKNIFLKRSIRKLYQMTLG